MTRHHAVTNNILLTRNLYFDSDVRQRRHPLMIPLHFLWAKSNNRTPGQFECDMNWLGFCYDFVQMHGAGSKVNGVEEFLNVDGQGGWRVLKIG